jgi:hypothetical protein
LLQASRADVIAAMIAKKPHCNSMRCFACVSLLCGATVAPHVAPPITQSRCREVIGIAARALHIRGRKLGGTRIAFTVGVRSQNGGEEIDMKVSSIIIGLATAAACALTATAYAGLKLHNEVVVNAAGRTAHGSTGDARASADTHQVIGCFLYQNSSTAESLAGACEAVDANGNYVSCFFPSAAISGFAKVLATTSATSYYYFQWDTTGACTYVYTNVESDFTPIAP